MTQLTPAASPLVAFLDLPTALSGLALAVAAVAAACVLRGTRRRAGPAVAAAPSAQGELIPTILDHAPVMMWSTDTTHGCTWVNQNWVDYSGMSEAEAFGVGWLERVHEDDANRVVATFGKVCLARQRFTCRYRFRVADGSWRWVDAIGEPAYDAGGAFVGYVGACLDVTESHGEQQRQAALAQVVDRSGDFIAVADLSGVVTHLNPAARALVGLDADAPLDGLKLAELYDPESAETWQEQILPQAVRLGEWQGRVKLSRLDGGPAIEVEQAAIRVTDPYTGQPAIVATISRGVPAAEADAQVGAVTAGSTLHQLRLMANCR